MIQHVCDIALDILPEWKFTPRIHWVKKRSKSSHGAGKFSIKLRASKNLSYNNCNCKSGRHNRRHSFTQRIPWKIRADTKSQTVPCKDFKVKTSGNNKVKFKFPPPRRQARMDCALYRRQVATHLASLQANQHILPYDEPDLCNDYISRDADYNDCFTINFPRHCVLGHVLLDSDPLDELGSWMKVSRPTKKPRSVGPHKSK